MEKIIELAHALGEEIAKSTEIKTVAAAKDAYEADADLQAKLAEYTADRKLLSDEVNKDEQDGGMIEDIKGRMDELSREIVKHPLYVAFADAQKAMNDLMTAVNDEIKFCITGERPSHCTHDCSTCGGCHG